MTSSSQDAKFLSLQHKNSRKRDFEQIKQSNEEEKNSIRKRHKKELNINIKKEIQTMYCCYGDHEICVELIDIINDTNLIQQINLGIDIVREIAQYATSKVKKTCDKCKTHIWILEQDYLDWINSHKENFQEQELSLLKKQWQIKKIIIEQQQDTPLTVFQEWHTCPKSGKYWCKECRKNCVEFICCGSVQFKTSLEKCLYVNDDNDKCYDRVENKFHMAYKCDYCDKNDQHGNCQNCDQWLCPPHVDDHVCLEEHRICCDGGTIGPCAQCDDPDDPLIFCSNCEDDLDKKYGHEWYYHRRQILCVCQNLDCWNIYCNVCDHDLSIYEKGYDKQTKLFLCDACVVPILYKEGIINLNGEKIN